MSGRLEAIHVAAASGDPMSSVERIEAIADTGLAGDRHAGAGSDGQVTVVAQEELASAAADCGLPIGPGATRRNLTLSGVELEHREGFLVRVGSVLLEFVESAEPCGLMDRVIGQGAKEALKGRAGLRMRVVEGGRLQVGDAAGPSRSTDGEVPSVPETPKISRP